MTQAIDNTVYSALLAEKYAEAHRPEILDVIKSAMLIARDDPSISADELGTAINLAAQKLDRLRQRAGSTEPYLQQNEYITGLIDLLGAADRTQLAGKILVGVEKIGRQALNDLYGDSWRAQDRGAAQRELREMSENVLLSVWDRPSADFNDIVAFMRDDPRFSEAASSYLEATLGVPNTDAATLLDLNPEFRDRQEILDLSREIRSLLSEGGNDDRLSELRASLTVHLRELLDEHAGTMNASFQATLEECRQRGQERLRHTLKREQLKSQEFYTGTRATLSILSAVAKFTGDEAFIRTAHQAEQVGSVLINSHAALATFVNSEFSAVAAGIFTANFLQAGLSLAGAFADQGPAPEQLILDQLRAIRQDIADLRAEMHERFDEIERRFGLLEGRLTEVMDQATENTERVIAAVNEVRDSLAEISGRLTGISDEVSSLRREIHDRLDDLSERLEAGFREEYLADVETYGHYAESSHSLIPEADFNIGLGRFAARALEVSRDALMYSFDPSSDFTNQAANQILADGRLDNKLDYLAEMARARFEHPGMKAIGGQPLPNPSAWAHACNYYVKLSEDFPEHHAQLSTYHLDRLIDAGREILTALRSIKTGYREDDVCIQDNFLYLVTRNYDDALVLCWFKCSKVVRLFQEEHLGGLDLGRQPSLTHGHEHQFQGPLPGVMRQVNENRMRRQMWRHWSWERPAVEMTGIPVPNPVIEFIPPIFETIRRVEDAWFPEGSTLNDRSKWSFTFHAQWTELDDLCMWRHGPDAFQKYWHIIQKGKLYLSVFGYHEQYGEVLHLSIRGDQEHTVLDHLVHVGDDDPTEFFNDEQWLTALATAAQESEKKIEEYVQSVAGDIANTATENWSQWVPPSCRTHLRRSEQSERSCSCGETRNYMSSRNLGKYSGK